MMGGVQMEIDCTTTTPGLFVAGEDAGGVHGANRLGGNGVANSTVFGAIAGDEMATAIGRGIPLRDPDLEFVEQAIARAEKPFGQAKADLSELRERLWSVMWDKVGILRTADGIREGVRVLDDCRETLTGIGVENDDRAFNLTWHDWLNLDNQITVSQAIAGASLARDDSRGAHFREDFPTTGNLEQSTYTCTRYENGQLIQEMAPVAFTIVKPGESLIDGEAGAPRAAQNGDPS
jgi:fumarate reductase flavoprotein subunit